MIQMSRKRLKPSFIALILSIFSLLVVIYLLILQYRNNQLDIEYKNTLQTNTLESYNKFIRTHKNTKYSSDIIYYRDKQAFIKAKEIDTLESYQLFLDTYPNSPWYGNVVYFRDKKALERAKEIATLESYQLFLDTYPNSSWYENAVYFRDNKALERAKEIGTLRGILSFFKNYPRSDWLPQAEYFLNLKFGFETVYEAESYLMKNDKKLTYSKLNKKNANVFRGDEIINDVNIFSHFYKKQCERMRLVSPKFTIRLANKSRPNIKSIVRKYGKEDKKIHGDFQDYFLFKFDGLGDLGELENIDRIIIFRYGNYGFVVQE